MNFHIFSIYWGVKILYILYIPVLEGAGLHAMRSRMPLAFGTLTPRHFWGPGPGPALALYIGRIIRF